MKIALLIDDKANDIFPSLEDMAILKEYQIITAISVEEGLKYLDEYEEAIDIVLLDINFPEKQLQGEEALQIIKSKHRYLPVIMLTDNDSTEHILTAVSCIKGGAFDYVLKRNLNTIQLFNTIENAVGLASPRRKQTTTKEDKEDCFHIIKSENTITKYFGFKLACMPVLSGIGFEEFTHGLIKWNKQLVEAAGGKVYDDLHMKIRYQIVEKKEINISLVFKIRMPDTDNHYDHTARFLKDILSLIGSRNNPPYLMNLLSGDICYDIWESKRRLKTSMRFFKKSLLSEDNSIGFSSKGKVTPKNNILPVPPPESFSFITDDIIKCLSTIYPETYIDIDASPAFLSVEDLDTLNKPVLKSVEDMQKVAAIQNYCKDLANDSRNLFYAQVTLHTNEKEPSVLLTNSIAKTFFGNREDVDFYYLHSDNGCNYSMLEEESVGHLSFVYGIHTINTIFRLPVPYSTLHKNVELVSSSFLNYPPEITESGVQIGNKQLPLSSLEVNIQRDALFRHLYLLGQTGTGKSTFIKGMAKDLIEKGEGCCIIDPHGDLFEDILKLIPNERKKDVVLFDTSNIVESAKLNLLTFNTDKPEQKANIVQDLVRSLGQSYNMKEQGGFMFELFLRAAVYLAIEESSIAFFGHSATLNEVKNIIENEKLRDTLLNKTNNKQVLTAFAEVRNFSGDQSWANFIPYINSKLAIFTDNPFVNALFNAQNADLDFRHIMDNKKILLVRLDKGQIGFGNLNLIGGVFFSKLIMAIMSRSETDKKNRTPYYVFVDEFQNFIQSDISDALAEVRKYNVSLTLANQTLGQLDQRMLDAVLGNVGNTIFFRPGINDYDKINHFLEPEFTRQEILKLPNFNCIARLLIDNIPSEPFVMQTKRI
jgi:CheY-like chemotaxis protein